MSDLKLYLNKNEVEVGIDEVGRGCLMGRVYAAAVILPQEFPDDYYKNIKDSKRLSQKKRDILNDYIKENAISYGIGYATVQEIDKLNIYHATILAMHRALDNLDISVDRILVDGDRFKAYYDKDGNFPSYTCITKGDSSMMSIAAASILAKCARDNYVKDIVVNENSYKVYGWLSNKGYGTKQHMNALETYGVTIYHRLTFNPCNKIDKKYQKNIS
jgi:ribonuclease HII